MARFTRQTRRNDSKIAGMYDLEERLGAGHFAEVKLARHVFTGERVAVKVIDKMKLDDTAKHHLFQEVRCMKLVQHPNIVRLYEVIDTNTKLYLVQELGDGGDMYDYIMKHEQGLDEENARRYFRQILQAIHYCHKLYVVHRDLKPENVIFFKKFDVAKLTDFGFSNKFLPGKKLETACGSLAYSAPEILLGDSYDAPAVDVWSLGVILYMMVVGKAPFYEINESETLTMILDCKFHVPDYVSPACKRLISRMIVRDVTKRAILEEIMSDPWITEDHGPMIVTTIPLANQVPLEPDQHDEIVQKMLLGDIADKETIKKCLEAGSYNHISATYYLLAEQVLRRLRWHKNATPLPLPKPSIENICSPTVPKKSNGVTLVGAHQPLPNVPEQGSVGSVEPIEARTKDHEEPDTKVTDVDTNLLTNRVRYHSTESIYDQVKNGGENDNEPVLASVSVNVTKKQMKNFQKQRVFGVKSTPVFLNQISEEHESDLDDSPRASPRVRRLSRRTLGVVQSTCRHSWSSGGRSSSVSSSSEEDGDLDKKMRRLSTERCRRSPKRRSDDEGDGDDGEDGTTSSRGVARKKKMRERSQSDFDETNMESEEGAQSKVASVDLLGAVLTDKLIEVHFKLNEFKESDEVRSEQNDSNMMNATNDNGEKVKRGASLHKLERKQSWEGNFHGRESVTWTVRETLEEDNETTDEIVSDGVEKDVSSKDEDAEQGLIRIGIVEDGILKYGVCADVVAESEDSMDEIVDSKAIDSKVNGENTAEEIVLKDQVTQDITDRTIEGEQYVVDGVSQDDDVIWDHINDVIQGHIDDVIQSHDHDGDVIQSHNNDVIQSHNNHVIQSHNNDVIEAGIMGVFQEGQCTEEDNTDGTTMMDFSELDICANGAAPKVMFRGSDIDEIEMYMKAKDNGLELESVGVRTIYHNRKVSQVTSNCCQII